MKCLPRLLIFLRLFIEQVFSEKAQLKNGTAPIVCYLSPYLGNGCVLSGQQWYYNPKLSSCITLKGSSCSSSRHLFKSLSLCEKTCQKTSSRRPSSVCFQKPEGGMCSSVHHAWYFDARSRLCKMFDYTYCKKRLNFFLSELKCEQICLPHTTPKAFCSLPPVYKHCRYRKYPWYFDEYKNVCLVYPSHRCGTNSNRFRTNAECMKRCSYSKGKASS
uniref:Pancreatic trypsin inhibitor n=1 Tax=Rhipicephalus zambeziensis TaxID=60191 RepID=A0A224YB49_9ACAR